MKLAKEKGKSAEQIFKYFDKDGDQKITADEFKNGLAALDPVRGGRAEVALEVPAPAAATDSLHGRGAAAARL